MRPDLSDDLFQSLMWGHVRLMSRVAIYLYLFLRCLSHCILGRTLSFGTIMILYSLVIPKTIFRNFMQLSWFISAGNNEHGSCEAMILSINFSFFFPGCLLFTYRIELFVFFFLIWCSTKNIIVYSVYFCPFVVVAHENVTAGLGLSNKNPLFNKNPLSLSGTSPLY